MVKSSKISFCRENEKIDNYYFNNSGARRT